MRNSSYGKRFVAAVIDFVILSVVSNLFVLVCGISTKPLMVLHSGEITVGLFSPSQLVFTFLTLIYFTMLEYSGYTIGKAMFGINVVDKFGTQVSLSESFLRNLIKLFSLLTLGSGFFVAIFNKRGLMLHDLVAETRVVTITNEAVE